MTISLQDAQAGLADLIHHLSPGEQVVITEGDRPIAVLSSVPARPQRPGPGLLQGPVTLIDDDESLADFAEYLS